MISLRTYGTAINIFDTIVAKIVSKSEGSICESYSQDLDEIIYLADFDVNSNDIGCRKCVINVSSLENLEIGDIVLIDSIGVIRTLFRFKSEDNSLFVTDRCNSNCLMCSQPPRNVDDLEYFFNINTQLVKMIPKSTTVLGITGGEPTLLGKKFIKLLEVISDYLPNTQIHVLTNGRSFAWKNIPEKISKINNPNIVFGIPLYSDFYQDHDYIVQAKNAYNQTLLGLYNMARFGLRIELRVVLHKLTYKRLYSLSKFSYKNLPFIEHIAFMGLEYTGYTPKNNDLLWIEPSEYENELEQSVNFLNEMGMTVSIYNLPLCLLKQDLRRYAKNSISDWKRQYLDECNKCTMIDQCGGIFSTSKKHFKGIKSIKEPSFSSLNGS